MHSKEAKASGETDKVERTQCAARNTVLYGRERTALAWTEAVTLVSETHVPDEVYEFAKQEFEDPELVNLTLVIVLMNSWNRFNIASEKYRATIGPAS